MFKSINITKTISKPSFGQEGWKFYVLTGLLVNLGIWTLALLYLKVKAPTYTSSYTITLTAAGNTTNINLPGIGQAQSQSDLLYGTNLTDPRENYKFIALSDPVIYAAARQLNLEPEQFGEPRVKIVVNTTLMTFDFKGSTPEEAQKKALALHRAFSDRIRELRLEDLAQQNMALQETLSAAEQKLRNAQERLLQYQARSNVSNNQQIAALAERLEDLLAKQALKVGELAQVSSRSLALEKDLGLSPKQAADAFTLQADSTFQQYLAEYSSTQKAIAVLNSRFQPIAPQVTSETAKREELITGLLEQGKAVLRRPVTFQELEQLKLTSEELGRDKLLYELVTTATTAEGLRSEVEALQQQRQIIQRRLQEMAQEGVALGSLQRDVQIAEAIFSSTLARLGTSKAALSAAYPPIQLLTQPSSPTKPSSPKKSLALLGAFVGTLFFTSGWVTLALHRQKVWVMGNSEAK